ncbi:MAG: retropepsin-like domain-containing protein [Nanoarchaeota archaeon]|nr:retropepsin-like domain-containing protein [Nanoarchaeota archaeon]
MSRINLIVCDDPKDLSNVALLRSIRGSVKIPFIVDTGSPSTLIPYQKVLELNLLIKDFVADEDISLIGSRHKAYRFPKKILFYFLCSDGKYIRKEFDPIVVKPVVSNRDVLAGNVLTDMIIGLDFLLDGNFVLFCDMKSNIAYLENRIPENGED